MRYNSLLALTCMPRMRGRRDRRGEGGASCAHHLKLYFTQARTQDSAYQRARYIAYAHWRAGVGSRQGRCDRRRRQIQTLQRPLGHPTTAVKTTRVSDPLPSLHLSPLRCVVGARRQWVDEAIRAVSVFRRPWCRALGSLNILKLRRHRRVMLRQSLVSYSRVVTVIGRSSTDATQLRPQRHPSSFVISIVFAEAMIDPLHWTGGSTSHV
ncbi:hypothetical protein EVAR_14776_1 [Eumeta japonica]|uniref:Uncharacterized protein n=1 Tax=Eumeta variegata TaxID=151549 RepID=A0A4C1TWF3_EUMVA|nr:hypothetical protein EVAR_14776_1 [Eumeta japonica]